jgi:seryl-tRNA synthetase
MRLGKSGQGKKQGSDTSARQDVNRSGLNASSSSTEELTALEQRRAKRCSCAEHPARHRAGGERRRRTTSRFGGTASRPLRVRPQAHWDLGPALGIIDFERGTKIAAARSRC